MGVCQAVEKNNSDKNFRAARSIHSQSFTDNRVVIKEVAVINIEREIVECIPVFECENSKELFSEENYPIVLSCGDTVCLNCYKRFVASDNRCPYDNQINTFSGIVKNKILLKEIASKKATSDQKHSKSIEGIQTCPNHHELKWINSDKICSVHNETSKPVIGCLQDNFYLCILRCLSNKVKFKTDKCIFDHQLMLWINTEFNCVKCKTMVRFGLSCLYCKDYTQCLKCCEFRFGTHFCPARHELKWSSTEQECNRCLKTSQGYLCQECRYFICVSETCRKIESQQNTLLDQLAPSLQKQSSIKVRQDGALPLKQQNISYTLQQGTGRNSLQEQQLKAKFKQRVINAHESNIYSLIKLNETRIASASADKLIKIWDLAYNSCIKTFEGHHSYIYTLVRLNNGQIASGSEDTTVKIWHLIGSNCIRTLTGHTKGVLSLALLERQGHTTKLISSGKDFTIIVWDCATYTNLKKLDHSETIYSVIVLNNEEIVSVAHKSVKVWNAMKGSCRLTIDLKEKPLCLAKLSETKFLSSGEDKEIKAWEVSGLTATNYLTLFGHTAEVRSLCVLSNMTSDNSTSVILSGGKDLTIRLWINKETIRIYSGHQHPIYTICKLNEENFLSGGADKTIRLWEL